MGLILAIETATPGICSAALGASGKIIAQRESFEDRSHASQITVFVDELMKEAGKKFTDLSAVAVSKGPGSYTGLRIGVSVAKGICFAVDVPLLSLNTLDIMSYEAEVKAEGAILCPMIDARRMEVYYKLLQNGKDLKPTAAEVIDDGTFNQWLQTSKVAFFGDGMPKCQPLLQHHPNALFIKDIYPRAANMIAAAEKKFTKMETEDLAGFEPFYLKDFVATTPQKLNRVLGRE